METTNDIANRFRAAARPVFGTVSGTAFEGFRIAVIGKRMFKQVSALAEQYGGVVAPDNGRYPQLMKISFPGAL